MSEGVALQLIEKFEVIHCYKCSIPFAVPAKTRRRWIDNGNSFYCPNGHSQCYTESNVQKLEKKLELEKKRKEWAERDAENQRKRADTAERRRRAQKGVNTKLKKRAQAGVCPCCNRTFKQLAAHMKNKHPDFINVKKK